MKRTFTVITIILALCFVPTGAFAAPGDSSSDPILITTAGELDAIRNAMNKYYKLNNDIDLSTYLAGSAEGWQPIGDSLSAATAFTGGLNGNSHKITGLWIKRGGMDEVGLFGCVYNATIESLGVEISSAGIEGNQLVGGVSGSQVSVAGVSSIVNCYVKGNVSGDAYVGGLVGRQAAYIISEVGSRCTIENCYATGSVKGNNIVGGLVGEQRSGGVSSIQSCYTRSNVSGYVYIGGLVGDSGASVANCYTTGNINGEFGAGGLVGYQSSGFIANCYTTGNISCLDSSGGIAGAQASSSSMTSCYATGNLSGMFNIGMLIGMKNGNITSSARYQLALLNGTPVSMGDMESVGSGRHGRTESASNLMTKKTYEDNFWLFYDSEEVGPWYWDSEGFPKLNMGTEVFPFDFSAVVPVITITVQPQAHVTVTFGSISGNLSVSASVSNSGALTYQWYSNFIDVNVGGTLLEGETNSSMAIPNDLEEGTHYFYCIVSSIGAAAIHSEIATVEVEKQDPVAVTAITISPKTPSISVNGTQQLNVSVTPENATDKSVTWSSSNPGIATVNSAGVVNGVSQGTVMITARSNSNTNVTDTCTVTVIDETVEVLEIAVMPKTLTIALGEARGLSVSVKPENATDKSVIWSSSNSAVASVNGSGVVIGQSDGTATITARSNSNTNITDTCTVTVTSEEIEVTGVTVSPEAITVAVGLSHALWANVEPENATDRSVSWSSGNSEIATVNSAGIVNAVSKGTATITARSNSNETAAGTCEVTVIEGSTPVQGVAVSPGSISIRMGDGYRLTADVTPIQALNKNVTWSSSNEEVAIVNQGGWVTALSAGKTTITARSNSDTSISGTCFVTVTVPSGGDSSGCNAGWNIAFAILGAMLFAFRKTE